MKKEMKKGISMILSLAMILTMSVGYHGKKVNAATKTAVKTQCTTYEGKNIQAQNYTGKQSNYYQGTMKSYLTALQDGSYMRVQYVSGLGKLLVEYYDKDYNLTDTKQIKEELPIFGGFYATDSNYYVVTGQENSEESDSKEVFRITKYDTKWNKLGTASLKGANTTTPFGAGSCRMDVSGKYLLIRTCHRMYKDSSGTAHQANVTIQLDMETMQITDSYTKVMNINYGYVSHSFNQFIKTENGHIISVDHGDANPRSIILLKYNTDFTTGKFTPQPNSTCTQIPVMEFKYLVSDKQKNPTGASVGGFEISDDHYLVAANTVKQDKNFDSYKTRNVFVAAVDKNTSKVTTHYLTNYDEGEETTTTPQMVKISGTRFMVLWTKGDQVYTAIVDNNGQKVGEIQHFTGSLSDCQPVISNGKVVWYTWKNGDINFYDVNTTDLTDHNVTEIHNGHQYVYDKDLDTDDTITFRCKECGDIKTEKKITLGMLYWRNSEETDGYYSTRGNGWKQKTGTTMTSSIKYTPTSSDANTELEVTSTDESVIYVEKASGINVKLIAKKAGTSTVTIKPKYNQSSVKTYKVTVYDPLQIDKLEVAAANPKIGEKVQLSAEAQNGSGNLQYKFYEENENGDQTEIQDYASKSTCEWTPTTLGKHTIYVEVKDSEGNIEKKSLENITVVKKQTKIQDIHKTYCYTIGAKDQKIDLKDYLPSDISNATYEAKITDPSGNLVSEADKTNTSYTYNVSKAGKAGDQAKIQFTVKSDNYEDMTFNVNIILTDKISVAPKEGAEPAIEGSNELTYGQKISDLKLNTTKAKFIAEDGSEVTGKLEFTDPDRIPTAGTKSAEYTFTPDKDQYRSYTGSVTIAVKKAIPQLSKVTVDETMYAKGKCRKDLHFEPGKATATYDGVEKEVSGTWSLESPNSVLYVGKSTMTLIFTPDDLNNYEKATQKVDVVVNLRLVASKTKVSCGDTIDLSIDPDTIDSSPNRTYKFFYVDETGYEKTIQAYSKETKCQWKPMAAGKYTVYVQVNGRNYKTAIKDIEVSKLKAPEISDITKKYPYTSGSGTEKINLTQLLPEDIKIKDQKEEIQDDHKILEDYEFSTANKQHTYSYWVNQTGKIGDTATIRLTIESDNYEDITIVIKIHLTDQITIEPKEDLTTDILNKNTLTYGEKTSYIGLKSTHVTLETKDGEKVYGSLKFKDPDEIPEPGKTKIAYIFVPQNKKYKDYEGSVTVDVEKQKPTLSGTSLKKIKYDQHKTKKDIPLEKYAAALIGEKMQAVSGTWMIEKEDEKLPLGDYQAVVKFTPDDTTHYTTAEIALTGQTFIELDTDIEDSAKVGDIIQLSADPKATNLQYKFYIEDSEGKQKIIQDFTSDSECKWVPEKEGTYTIYVEAKDENGNTTTASVKEITINKKEEEKPPVKDPESGDHGSDNGEPSKPGSSESGQPTTGNDQPTTEQKPDTNTNSNVDVGVKANQAATVNGIIYKVTKIENAKNAQVTITSLDKKKSSIVIPDYITINGVKCKVVTIKKKALYKGTKLKKLTIGKNVQTIEDNAFNGCKNLKSITIKSTVLKKVGKNAIKGIHKKAVIKVPKKQYKKYKKLFGKKSGFKKPMKLKK